MIGAQASRGSGQPRPSRGLESIMMTSIFLESPIFNIYQFVALFFFDLYFAHMVTKAKFKLTKTMWFRRERLTHVIFLPYLLLWCAGMVFSCAQGRAKNVSCYLSFFFHS